MTESPFQRGLISIFGSSLRTIPRLLLGLIFQFSQLGSSFFSTSFRLPNPSEEVSFFRHPAANSESPCRVPHSSSPGPNFRLALADLPSLDSRLRFLSLPSGFPSCLTRFRYPISLLTGSLSSFLWLRKSGPRGVLRSSSPSPFPLRATTSPC